MAYEVRVGQDAQNDLLSIREYISQSESPERARLVADRITDRIASLSELPYRGRTIDEPPEVAALEYREVFVTSFRIIYAVGTDYVQVQMIVDARREMGPLMMQELFSR